MRVSRYYYWPSLSNVMTVFRSRAKLSSKYVPERLPHRDAQLRQLREFFSDIYEGAPFFKVVQLIGSMGAGKTSTALVFSRRLKLEVRGAEPLYINLRMLNEPSPFLVYAALITELGGRPSRSLSAGELLLRFAGLVRRSGRMYLIVIDEADELVGSRSLKGGNVVYSLSRLPELGVSNVGGVVFISRREDWAASLSSEERSSMGSLVVRFPRYSRAQIKDILWYRVSEAFREGVVGEEIVDYVADVTVNYLEADLRKALDLLLYAGMVADLEGSGRVTLDHVVKALRSVLDAAFVSPEVISALNIHEKIALYAAILALERGETGYAELPRIREYAEMIYESFSIPRAAIRPVEVSLQKLYDLGIVSMKGPLKLYIPVELDVNQLRREILAGVKVLKAGRRPGATR